jgi:hypothetical protein
VNKRKVGLVLFWIGVVWGFLWGILGSIHQTEFYLRVLTFEELEQSIWATSGTLGTIYGFGPPLAALIAGVGLLLYKGASRSTVWKFAVGVFVAIIATAVIGQLGHHPLLYAIAATLILLFFFGALWFWAQERTTLQDQSSAASDLMLVGYVFMLNGVWFTCAVVSWYWHKAFAATAGDRPPLMDPIVVMIYFALGWLFLFLGQYKSRQQQSRKGDK